MKCKRLKATSNGSFWWRLPDAKPKLACGLASQKFKQLLENFLAHNGCRFRYVYVNQDWVWQDACGDER